MTLRSCFLAKDPARLSSGLGLPARDRLLRHVAALVVAATIAFVWVRHYGYRYDRAVFNSPGLNWWAFILWALGLLCFLEAFAPMERRFASIARSVVASCAGYYLTLFVVEYIGYVVLGIREVGHGARRPLAFNLIHGTTEMFVFYLTVPFVAILAFAVARRLMRGLFGARAANMASWRASSACPETPSPWRPRPVSPHAALPASPLRRRQAQNRRIGRSHQPRMNATRSAI